MEIEISVAITVEAGGIEMAVKYIDYVADVTEHYSPGDYHTPEAYDYSWTITPKPTEEHEAMVHSAVEKYLNEYGYERPEPDYDRD